MKLEKVKEEAENFGWKFEWMHGNGYTARFSKGNFLLDIWFDNMTIGIYEKDKPQKFFHDVPPEDLIDILDNPSAYEK